MIEPELLVNDISVFADIGTDPPSIHNSATHLTCRFIRNGEPTELDVFEEHILERYEGRERKHATLKALLASDRYGNLRQWAANQVLTSDVETDSSKRIELSGFLNEEFEKKYLKDINHALLQPHNNESARVLLIDGPAGIGKTYFISLLAYERALNFASSRDPLLLHVQSRGRNLSYIYDLIAFSLQRLRVDVTYDQVPVLARYGLITIAIDGFDELADPEGYALAWSQVSEIIEGIRGSGSIILAGRETFIGRERVLRDIASLREDVDDLNVLTLQAPSKSHATRWLVDQGWSNEQVDSIKDFLEDGSLVLRPFFLRQLSNADIADRISVAESSNVLTILIEAMTDREISKFGDQVERAMGVSQRRKYILGLMGEAAREMAENSSSSISDATLSFMVDLVLPATVPDQIRSILKARADSIAYLTNDERRGYKRFFHEKFLEYFLSHVTLRIITDGEQSKFLSRGIIGSSFLETFSTVLSASHSNEELSRFFDALDDRLSERGFGDRERRNLGALCVSTLAARSGAEPVILTDTSIEEARVVGTAHAASISNIVFNQLDVRGADLSQIRFEQCAIVSLIADSTTRLPADFPSPSLIRDVAGRTLTDPEAIREWIVNRDPAYVGEADPLTEERFLDHPAVQLLMKACRMRQYWLRSGDDVFADKILSDDNWPILHDALDDHYLLRTEYRQASGAREPFFHIRRGDEILDVRNWDSEIRAFLSDLKNRLEDK